MLSESQYRILRRSAFASIAFSGLAVVLLATGHAHLAGKMDVAIEAAQDAETAAMLSTLRRILRGSALVLFSVTILLAVGLQYVWRLVKNDEG